MTMCMPTHLALELGVDSPPKDPLPLRGIYSCIHIHWGIPVYGNAIPYVGVPQVYGNATPYTVIPQYMGTFPLELDTHTNTNTGTHTHKHRYTQTQRHSNTQTHTHTHWDGDCPQSTIPKAAPILGGLCAMEVGASTHSPPFTTTHNTPSTNTETHIHNDTVICATHWKAIHEQKM